MKHFNKLVAGVCIAAMLAGCATTDAGGAPRSNMDKAIASCMGTVLVGALLGAAIGNNSGRGNAGRGAVMGAAAGGAVCAVLLAMASQKDKEQLAQAQRAALASNQAQQVSYTGDDGKARLIRVSAPVEVADPKPATAGATARVCRMTHTQVSVSGVGDTSAPDQMYCRDANGDWAPG